VENLIYVLKNSDSYYKIGCSVNPQKRVKQLSTGSTATISIVKLYETVDDYKIESFIHSYFKSHSLQILLFLGVK
jgi:hypothetical protein